MDRMSYISHPTLVEFHSRSLCQIRFLWIGRSLKFWASGKPFAVYRHSYKMHDAVGEEYLVLDRPLSVLTEHLAKDSSAEIILSCPVVCIQRSGSRVLVTCGRGRQISCEYVILAVPLRILQRGDILFQPQLPVWKQKAIQRLKMSNAVKVRPEWFCYVK